MTGPLFSMAALLACLVLSGGAQAKETLIASSGQARVQLIELFSSESCSSCPPADAWISTLQDRAGLWKKFVPVVFHVDYWNHLGWKDGFSSDEMTKRQVALSQQWAVPSVYTPAVVVDGKEWRGWRSDGQTLPSSSAQGIELSIFKNDDGSYLVKATGLSSKKKYVLRAAKLGMSLSTDVKGGENSGRLLKHNFLVLDWNGKSISQASPEASFKFKESKASRLGLAAWIEEEGNPTPLQSVGGYL